MTLHSVGDDDNDDDDNISTSNMMIRDSIDDCTNGFGMLDGAMYWMDMLLPVDLFVKVRRTCSVYCKTIGLFFVLGSGTNDLRSMSTEYLGCQVSSLHVVMPSVSEHIFIVCSSAIDHCFRFKTATLSC